MTGYTPGGVEADGADDLDPARADEAAPRSTPVPPRRARGPDGDEAVADEAAARDPAARAAAIYERWRARLQPVRRPASTYRLQLTPSFGFVDAARVVPYLATLGVSDLYISPPFAAAQGSQHGYDVVDHNTLRPELGGEDGFAELAAALRRHGLGLVVDFVPNHMGIGPTNAWWMDLLENGPSSLYAPFFDVDWRPLKPELEHRILVPVLGDQFGEVLERGELRLVREEGAFWLHYWDHRFPIAPRQVPRILEHRLDELRAELGPQDVQLQELESIITALEKLAPRHEVDAAKVAERAREKEVAKRRLAALFEACPRIAEFVDQNVAVFNGTPGEPRSFDLLDALLDNQAYRLAHWRVAGEEINYRRFFDINGLAAIRMEEERVFLETHRLVFRLVREGIATGLRIDHPDGLYLPSAYFRQLQERLIVERLLALEGIGDAENGVAAQEREELASALAEELRRGEVARRRLEYVVGEKILEPHERMPASWCIDGTTGYDFLTAVNGLFVDRRHARAFDTIYARFTGDRTPFAELVYAKKRLIMASSMASEVNVLAWRLNRISGRDRRTRDFTLNSLVEALRAFVACLPIYRTYVEGTQPGDVDGRDRQYVDATIAAARKRAPTLNESVFAFLRDILLLRHPETLSEAERAERVEFVRKLQQVTGPVAAKAIEDTAFYVYNRLVSLNEVGGDPSQFGTEPGELHRLNAERLARWPGSLNATSTHDTKRGEDIRLRIDALSEIPGEWGEQLRRWSRLNRAHKTLLEGRTAPDRNDELLLYQTLVGAWPDGPEGERFDGPAWNEVVGRLQAYMEKALKEAKVHTTWTNPNDPYDGATKRFLAGILGSRAFLADFVPFQRRIARTARVSSLAQVALKIASPGVTDVYQGCELWDLSLVDPDNRRPVDWDLRRRLLDGLARRLAEGPAARAALADEVLAPDAQADGRAKLLLLHEALKLRREDPDLFLRGDYVPLHIEGSHASHVFAFARAYRGRTLLCVVPRLVLSLMRPDGVVAWDGRVLAPRDLTRPLVDVVSGRAVQPGAHGAIPLAACFAGFPVALLRST